MDHESKNAKRNSRAIRRFWRRWWKSYSRAVMTKIRLTRKNDKLAKRIADLKHRIHDLRSANEKPV